MLVLDEDAKVSTMTSLSDLRIRDQRLKLKFKTVSNDKINSLDVLSLDKHAKVITVTSSDTQIKDKSQRNTKLETLTPNLPRALEKGTGSSSSFSQFAASSTF